MEIRPARPGEASLLSTLAFNSKRYWGYDDDFMEKCREELTVSPEYITANRTYVLEEQGEAAGFYVLKGEAPEVEMTFLFIDPSQIRKGYGRVLWEHAVGLAKELGVRRIDLESDPYAEDFYTAMGAVTVGWAPSGSIPGRYLPLMRYDIS